MINKNLTLSFVYLFRKTKFSVFSEKGGADLGGINNDRQESSKGWSKMKVIVCFLFQISMHQSVPAEEKVS